ncbi:MAG: hypothetical protein AB7F28_08705 [Candidatus Margulisiibacteriota bacterium]
MKNRILVISKSPIIASMIELALGSYTAEHAFSLDAALEITQDQKQQPNLFIVEDRFVSNQVYGLKMLRSMHPTVPVLALMTRQDPTWAACLSDAGASACFYGCFSESKKLKRTIERVLGK